MGLLFYKPVNEMRQYVFYLIQLLDYTPWGTFDRGPVI